MVDFRQEQQQTVVTEQTTTRFIDTREYVSALRELVQEGREVSMTVAGSSMSPFLCHRRDRIFFRAPDRELRKGDIVFYQRDSGQFVCHRVQKVRKIQTVQKVLTDGTSGTPNAAVDGRNGDEGSTDSNYMYDMVGDNQTEIEHNIRRDQIFAVITKVERKGKIIQPGDFWWFFFEKIWIRMIPLRRMFITLYGLPARIRKKA